MADGCFLIFCGIPASGKSTFAQELIKRDLEIVGKRVHFIYINYDDFIPENLPITDLTSAEKWKDRRRIVLNGVQKLLLPKHNMNSERNNQFFSQGPIFVSSSCPCDLSPLNRSSDILHVIVVDDNMFYRSMRYQYYQLARKTSFGFSEVYFHCPVDLALKRNSQRSSSVSENTIIKMFHVIEKPEPLKFSWEKFSILFDSSRSQSVDAWKIVVELLEKAAAIAAPPFREANDMQKTKDRSITEKSIVHQADQVIRKHISQKLDEMKAENFPSERLKQQAQFLNERRKMIMEKIKKDPKKIMHQFLTCNFNTLCPGVQPEKGISTKAAVNETQDEILNYLQRSVECPLTMDEAFLMENFWDIISTQEFGDVVRMAFEQT